jgi:hypothetical protein
LFLESWGEQRHDAVSQHRNVLKSLAAARAVVHIGLVAPATMTIADDRTAVMVMAAGSASPRGNPPSARTRATEEVT